MYRNFVPAEFTSLTKQTFCDQFNHALDLLTDIDQLKEKNEPDEADKDAVKDKTSQLINILVDDWEYRWVEIINCDKIDITQISRVIEFLGLLLSGNIEIANKCRGCRQSRIKTVEKVFDMVKRLSLPKRVAWNKSLIKQKDSLIIQKKGAITTTSANSLRILKKIESVEKDLEEAEAEWFEELRIEQWNEKYMIGRIQQWNAADPENRDKIKVTAKEIKEYQDILISKSLYQMTLDSQQIQARKQIEKARQLYLNEFGQGGDQELERCILARNYKQKYYDLIVEKLPSLGVLLSQSQKKYYEIIRRRSFVLKDLEENTTEIEKLNTNIQQLASDIHILQFKGRSLFDESLSLESSTDPKEKKQKRRLASLKTNGNK